MKTNNECFILTYFLNYCQKFFDSTEILLCHQVDFAPRAMNILFLVGQVTAKPTVVAMPIKHLLAFLAGYAIVIAYPIMVSTIHTDYASILYRTRQVLCLFYPPRPHSAAARAGPGRARTLETLLWFIPIS